MSGPVLGALLLALALLALPGSSHRRLSRGAVGRRRAGLPGPSAAGCVVAGIAVAAAVALPVTTVLAGAVLGLSLIHI